MPITRDYYEVLGIEKTASTDDWPGGIGERHHR